MTYNVFGGTLKPIQMQLRGMVVNAPACALLGGLVVGAWVSLLWQHMCLMRNVSEDASTRCMAGLFITDVTKDN